MLRSGHWREYENTRFQVPKLYHFIPVRPYEQTAQDSAPTNAAVELCPLRCLRRETLRHYASTLRYADPRQFHLTTLPLLTAEEVSEQILRAHNAQPEWAKTSSAQRQSFLRSLKAWVLEDMEGIVRVACRDTGKTSEWGTRGARRKRTGLPVACL